MTAMRMSGIVVLKSHGTALLASGAVHAVVVSVLLLVPWQTEVRSIRAVFPVEIAESSPPVSPVRPTASAKRRSKAIERAAPAVIPPTPPMPEASIQRETVPGDALAESKEPVRTMEKEDALRPDEGSGQPRTQTSGTPEVPAVTTFSVPVAPAVVSARITHAARPTGGYQVRPIYPPAARRALAEGTTLLRVHVLTDGSIGEVRVERSAGHGALDEAAAAAVSKWHFEPARNGSDTVAMWVVIPVEFRIQR
jgi:protein TonB